MTEAPAHAAAIAPLLKVIPPVQLLIPFKPVHHDPDRLTGN